MKDSFSIKFYLNPAKLKSNKQQIYLRIIVAREKVEMATKLFVDPKLWSSEAGRTLKTSAINDELAEIENEIRKLRRQLLDDDKKLSARLIKLHYKGENKIKAKALDYFRAYVDGQAQLAAANKIASATVTAYNTTCKHLESFISYKKLGNVGLKELDYSFISNLDLYLKTVYLDRHGKNICTNYVNKQHSRVRTVLHKAVREGMIVSNPYSTFTLKNEKTTRERLTEEELEKLANHSFHGNKSLEKVRDFSCLAVIQVYAMKMPITLK